MKTYETFEQVEGMDSCRKKPIVVHAKQVDEEFRVNTLEGNYKQGKPGDYLMKGIDGELYICDREIFEKTYDWVEDKPIKTETIEVEFSDEELLRYMTLAHELDITFNQFVERALLSLLEETEKKGNDKHGE